MNELVWIKSSKHQQSLEITLEDLEAVYVLLVSCEHFFVVLAKVNEVESDIRFVLLLGLFFFFLHATCLIDLFPLCIVSLLDFKSKDILVGWEGDDVLFLKLLHPWHWLHVLLVVLC